MFNLFHAVSNNCFNCEQTASRIGFYTANQKERIKSEMMVSDWDKKETEKRTALADYITRHRKILPAASAYGFLIFAFVAFFYDLYILRLQIH